MLRREAGGGLLYCTAVARQREGQAHTEAVGKDARTGLVETFAYYHCWTEPSSSTFSSAKGVVTQPTMGGVKDIKLSEGAAPDGPKKRGRKRLHSP